MSILNEAQSLLEIEVHVHLTRKDESGEETYGWFLPFSFLALLAMLTKSRCFNGRGTAGAARLENFVRTVPEWCKHHADGLWA